jgi:hypothetical protein
MLVEGLSRIMRVHKKGRSIVCIVKGSIPRNVCYEEMTKKYQLSALIGRVLVVFQYRFLELRYLVSGWNYM